MANHRNPTPHRRPSHPSLHRVTERRFRGVGGRGGRRYLGIMVVAVVVSVVMVMAMVMAVAMGMMMGMVIAKVMMEYR